jgi:hypothetical protein
MPETVFGSGSLPQRHKWLVERAGGPAGSGQSVHTVISATRYKWTDWGVDFYLGTDVIATFCDVLAITQQDPAETADV